MAVEQPICLVGALMGTVVRVGTGVGAGVGVGIGVGMRDDVTLNEIWRDKIRS